MGHAGTGDTRVMPLRPAEYLQKPFRNFLDLLLLGVMMIIGLGLMKNEENCSM